MTAALVRLVWQRAGHCCEYCRIPQDFDEAPFEIDHAIARKHGGRTVTSNLVLSCFHDNSHMGSDIAGLDPKTRRLTPLSTRGVTGGRGIFAGKGLTSSAAPVLAG